MGVVPMGLWIARLSLAARGDGRRHEAGWAVLTLAGGVAAGQCSLFSGSPLAGSGRRSLGGLLESWEWAEPSGPSKRAGAVGVLRSLPLARTHHLNTNNRRPPQLRSTSSIDATIAREALGQARLRQWPFHHDCPPRPSRPFHHCDVLWRGGVGQRTAHFALLCIPAEGRSSLRGYCSTESEVGGKVQQSDALTPCLQFIVPPRRMHRADWPGVMAGFPHQSAQKPCAKSSPY